MKPHVETVSGANLWRIPNAWSDGKSCQSCGRAHCCFFCSHEGCYEPMPKGHTLCARCGQLIFVPTFDDPLNDAMVVCERCEAELSDG